MTFFWVGESRRPACVNFTKARSILVVHLSSPAFNNLVPRLMPIDLIPDLSNFIILIVIVDKTFCPLAAAFCTRGLGSPHPKLIYVNCKTPVGGPRLHQTLPNVLCMCLPCSEFYDWPISLNKPDILELILLRPRPTPRLPWPSLPRRISFHQPYVVLP
jgi:hypothetical protein